MHITPEERYYLKLKSAHLFHIENKPLVEIAELLHLSRPTLNRLLTEAREEGIVNITINDIRTGNHHLLLEQNLREKLHLKDIKIIDTAGETQESVNAGIGLAAARHLGNLLKPGMTVGIGWGKTLQVMAKHIQPDPSVSGLNFVSLLGGLHTEDTKSYTTFANSLCENIASNYEDSTVSMLYTPMVAQSKTAAEAVLASDSIAAAVKKMKTLDVAVVGIDGDPGHSTTIQLEKSLQSIESELRAGGYVGNVCSRFYTIDGRLSDLSIEERIITIHPGDLKKTPIVIGAAGGKYKASSILGAARAELFNILITDASTAARLSEMTA